MVALGRALLVGPHRVAVVDRAAALPKQVRERFENVSKRDAFRLVYTEGTFVFNEAQVKAHEEDFETYRIVCADSGACDVCKALQREQVDEPARIKDRNPGANFPPLHAMCRCSYVVADDLDAWLANKMAGVGSESDGAVSMPFKKITGSHTWEHDLAAVNPNFDKTKRGKWERNCQRCVGTYEARRRGYDVTAKPRKMLDATHGDPNDELAIRGSSKGWSHMFENATLVKCNSSTGVGTRTKVETAMAKYGDGARAIVAVRWQKKYGGGGHVFIAEQRNGKTVFIDPQTNSTDCSWYFKKARKDSTDLLRIDDKSFTGLIIEACEEVKP